MDRYIYASDWKVLERLWEESPQTLMQLVHTLSKEVGWSKSTVATMVKRMEAKGLLRFEEGGKARLIYPTLTREEASRSETNGLIDNITGDIFGEMQDLYRMLYGAFRNDFTVGDQAAFAINIAGQQYIMWYDAQRDVIFNLFAYAGASGEIEESLLNGMLALAETVQ